MKKLVLSHHAVFGSLAWLSLTLFCQAFGQDCCQMSNGCISSNKTPHETAAASCRQQGGTPVLNAQCINRRCVQRSGKPVYQKVEATELRTTVAQLQPHNPGLKTEFERKITLAEENASRGNHPAAARALTSIGAQVYTTPDNELSSKEKIEVLRSLDQSWRGLGIKAANPHTIHENCKCSLKTGRCVEDPEGGVCSESRNAKGQWSCASAP
jgi:hypothetical protein